jgi:hypothetical protein
MTGRGQLGLGLESRSAVLNWLSIAVVCARKCPGSGAFCHPAKSIMWTVRCVRPSPVEMKKHLYLQQSGELVFRMARGLAPPARCVSRRSKHSRRIGQRP